MRSNVRIYVLAALGTSIMSTGAFAVADEQIGAANSSKADRDSDILETIVVTAQRRAENAQTVPVSINSLSPKVIDDTSYLQITDLQYVVPGLTYDPTNGSAFIIRGVGSTSFDFSNEKSVSIVVDDVVMDAQRDNGLTGMVDFAHADVLFGPQGTLFGKNSTSGVVSVTTNNPVLGEQSAKFYGGYGQRSDYKANVVVNTPTGENAALRLAAFVDGQDGYGRYVTLNKSLGAVNEAGIRSKILVQADDNLQMIFAADYEYHYDTSVRTAVGGPAYPFAPLSPSVTASEIALGVTPSATNADDADGQEGSILTREYGTSLHVKYNIGRDTLTSITAYRGTEYKNTTPADLLPNNVYSFIPVNIGDLFTNKISEELHLASPTGGSVEYLFGAFYNKLRAQQSQIQWIVYPYTPVDTPFASATTFVANTGAKDPVTGAALGNSALFTASNQTYAAFGNVKFNLSPAFSLTVGARYSSDNNGQSISYPTVPSAPYTGTTDNFIVTAVAPLAQYQSGSVTGDKFTYRIAPEYKIGDDAMVYATYSTGYKPGGIAYVGSSYDPYSPETVTSFEIGEKAEFFNHRLRLNVDAYIENFSDFQATILTPVALGGSSVFTLASAIGNAPGLRSKGVELTSAFKPMSSLEFSASLAYNDAYFTNYVASPTANYTGTPLPNAPRWMGFLGMDYVPNLVNLGKLDAHVDYSYRSSIQTQTGAQIGNLTAPAIVNADGTKTPNVSYSYVPGFSLVNMRVGFVPERANNVEVGVYARNVFNHYFSTGWQEYSLLGLLHYTSPDAYRTVGGYVKVSF